MFGTVGVKRRYVPHLKGLISGNLVLTARDSNFTFCHALLKKAILLLQKGKGAKTFLCLCI